MDLLPDFKDLLSALADSSAEYLVVGGWAVGFHTEPPFTKDLDLLIGSDPANLLRVVEAVRRFGAPPTIVQQLASLGPDEFLFSFSSWGHHPHGSTSFGRFQEWTSARPSREPSG